VLVYDLYAIADCGRVEFDHAFMALVVLFLFLADSLLVELANVKGIGRNVVHKQISLN
jgi:hypothetical protein